MKIGEERQDEMTTGEECYGNRRRFDVNKAPTDRAHKRIAMLTHETSELIGPGLWHPNGSDLNPENYMVWSICNCVCTTH